jgi:hypothetical protein
MNGSTLKWHINPMVAGMARVQNGGWPKSHGFRDLGRYDASLPEKSSPVGTSACERSSPSIESALSPGGRKRGSCSSATRNRCPRL